MGENAIHGRLRVLAGGSPSVIAGRHVFPASSVTCTSTFVAVLSRPSTA